MILINILFVLKVTAVVYLCVGAFSGLVIVGVALVFGRDIVFEENDYVPISQKEERVELAKAFFSTLFLWLPELAGILPTKNK